MFVWRMFTIAFYQSFIILLPVENDRKLPQKAQWTCDHSLPNVPNFVTHLLSKCWFMVKKKTNITQVKERNYLDIYLQTQLWIIVPRQLPWNMYIQYKSTDWLSNWGPQNLDPCIERLILCEVFTGKWWKKRRECVVFHWKGWITNQTK